MWYGNKLTIRPLLSFDIRGRVRRDVEQAIKGEHISRLTRLFFKRDQNPKRNWAEMRVGVEATDFQSKLKEKKKKNLQ